MLVHRPHKASPRQWFGNTQSGARQEGGYVLICTLLAGRNGTHSSVRVLTSLGLGIV